jgi:hypothetical protein
VLRIHDHNVTRSFVGHIDWHGGWRVVW